ncbi:molybdenum cofactor guanylyltransferase MobA [Kaarinaea lacus]
MNSIIHIKSLRKTHGKSGLLDINDFDIPHKKCIVLSGRNGAGKTTLLKILAGLDAPDSAEIIYEGKHLSWQSARPLLRRDVVYLHQQPLMFDRSVTENIAYGLRYAGLSKSEINEQTQQALAWAGLTHLAKRNAKKLSGGEKQRVALTRARILKPKLLLLDEPVANMDLESREQTITLIQRLKFEGVSTIVTSHEPNFARLLSNDHRHLCKTGPSRYTIVEPFLYEGNVKRQQPIEKDLAVNDQIQLVKRMANPVTKIVVQPHNVNSKSTYDINSMNNPDKMPKEKITAVILAGGRAQRMGGQDKGLLPLQGKPMIEYIIDALRPQVGHILINANRNLERYQQYGYPVVPDILGEYFGPLVGMASGIQTAKTEYVVTVPCDSPLLPRNLVSILYNSLQQDNAELAVAHDGERMQPVFALLRCELLPDLLNYLESGGRKIDTWYAQHQTALADFSESTDAFMNINSPNDKSAIEKHLSKDEAIS